jgi:hypothetical protein
MTPVKIDLLTPWKWKPDYDWFRRDLGLLVDPLRARGHDVRLVLLRADGMPLNDDRILGVERDQIESPEFWRSSHTELVITIAGFWPAAFKAHLAIKNAGCLLWNKMDTDGIWGLRANPWMALYNAAAHARMRRRPFPYLAGLSLLLYRAATNGDFRGIRIIEMADKFLVESPVAVSRARRFFNINRRSDLADSLVFFPGPAPDDRLFDAEKPKENRVLAVGRWDDFAQKDTPKLLRVLQLFLVDNSEFQADIIGHFGHQAKRLLRQIPDSIFQRIKIHGRLPNEALTSHYQRAKILFCPSRSESVHIVSAEAVCCGCSVVGSSLIASMGYYTGANSGTLSHGRTDDNLLDALNTEAHEWKRGERDPLAISSHFRGELSASAVGGIVDSILKNKPVSHKR